MTIICRGMGAPGAGALRYALKLLVHCGCYDG